jgi:hypothetical protein
MKQKYWLPAPALHDYPAALDFLELLYPSPQAAKFVAALKQAPTIIKKAGDLLRASGLPLLDQSDVHVKTNVRTVRKGKKPSPVLLVVEARQLIIADGYHRVCAIYELSEDLEVPCRLVHAR